MPNAGRLFESHRLIFEVFTVDGLLAVYCLVRQHHRSIVGCAGAAKEISVPLVELHALDRAILLLLLLY